MKSIYTVEVKEAIREAEAKTNAEIKLCVAKKCKGEPLHVAMEIFYKELLFRTKKRNAVLLFVSPKERKVAVVGDEGVHKVVGDKNWGEIIKHIKYLLSNNRPETGIMLAIGSLGVQLATYFPKTPDDTNELNDQAIEQ